MGEITKAVGQWIVGNVGWSVLIFLFILSCLFKITKIELDPLGWIIGWFGKMLTKDVRKDVADLKTETAEEFKKVKKDRADKVKEMMDDYDAKIKNLHGDVEKLKNDLDSFEKKSSKDINDVKTGTAKNCEELKKRMNEMEAAHQKSNDMQTIQNIRSHILDFANSCFNKRKHTKREFENIIDENALYEELIEKYKVKNNVYKEDYEYIMKVYHKCQEEGSFLTEGN